MKLARSGVSVQRHNGRWYAYYHRACRWTVGHVSDEGEANPFRVLADCLENASRPCPCPKCRPDLYRAIAAPLIGGGA